MSGGRTSRFYNVQLAHQDAWLCTALATAFNSFGMLMQATVSDVPNLPLWPMFASALVGAVVFALHFHFRKAAGNGYSNLFYLFNLAAVVASLLITNPYYAAGPKPWVPFQAGKLGCLITAMIAPDFRVGVIGIAAHSLSSTIQVLLFEPELKARMASAEPLASLAFGFAGILVLIHRFRRVALEKELAAVLLKAESDRRMSRAFLRIRDRMNTPLQVIELATAILRGEYKAGSDALDRIDRAAEDLRELNQILDPRKPEVD